MTKKNHNLASTKKLFNSDFEPRYVFETSENSTELNSRDISLKFDIIENNNSVIFINDDTEKLDEIAQSIASHFFCIAKLNLKEKTNYEESFVDKERDLIKSFFMANNTSILIQNVHYLEKKALDILIDTAIASNTKLVMTSFSSIPLLDERIKTIYFDGDEDIYAYELLVKDMLESGEIEELKSIKKRNKK